MESRHIDKYTSADIAAYLEVAFNKWEDGFVCRRENCNNTTYYEGATPYSRRCLKCKRDESATAHTAFDRMRMPLSACIEIARMIVNEEKKLTVDVVVDYLILNGHPRINKRSVWLMMSRIFAVMTKAKFNYDKELLFIIIDRTKLTVALMKGVCEGKVCYSYCGVGGYDGLYESIKLHTLVSTKVGFAYLKRHKDGTKYLVTKDSKYREMLPIDEAKVLSEAIEFSSWTQNLDYYCFKKNEHSYQELMNRLACSDGK